MNACLRRRFSRRCLSFALALALAGALGSASAPPAPPGPDRASQIANVLLRPVIAEWSGGATLEERHEALRDLWARAEERWLAIGELKDQDVTTLVKRGVTDRALKEALKEALKDRTDARAKVGEAFAKLLAPVAGGDPAAARAALERAVAEVHNRRKLRLFDQIKSKCPNENWNTTLLAVYNKNCGDARDQKKWIADWLEVGLSDEEIKRVMVAKVGTEKVLVRARSSVSYVAPFAILLVVAAGAFFALRGVLRRGNGGGGEPAAAAAGSGAEDTALDPEWEARIDKELEDLDR